MSDASKEYPYPENYDDRTRRDHIHAALEDLVGAFLFYDRKENEDLSVGDIEEAIEAGEITVDEMAEFFGKKLREELA